MNKGGLPPSTLLADKMVKQFYEKALPTSGVYCVLGLDRKADVVHHHFAETLDDVIDKVESVKKKKNLDVYVAMGTFKNHTRNSDNSLFHKSFFVDIDVGKEKAEKNRGYSTKQEAIDALNKFLKDTELPPPFIVDSGIGIHAYWILDEQIPAKEYRPYAQLFKKLCLKHLKSDPGATSANLAQVMRWIDSINYRNNQNTKVLDSTLIEYSFDSFKEFLGEPDEPVDVLASVQKGLDEDTKALLKLDNFKRTFQHLAERSLNDEGCGQIKNMLINASTLTEPLWWAGLSIAKFCDDGGESIHLMSEDYPNYSYADTEQKASRITAPKTCSWFISNFPEHCEGCAYKGSITTPISLARELKDFAEFKVVDETDSENSVREEADPEEIFTLPDFMTNFKRGASGGIYFIPPVTVDKKGNKKQSPPFVLVPYDIYATRRVYSKTDGECLVLRIMLPKDPKREVMMPMKVVYATENFKSFMSSNGVFVSPSHVAHLMEYIIKWGQYLQSKNKAENMRMQMGWTADPYEVGEWKHRGFVVGEMEINNQGEEIRAPASPLVKGVAKLLQRCGTYEAWRESADFLDTPGFELQAMAMLCGFASPIMSYTSTPGVTVCLLGKSGAAKTGSMYAGLSVFGQPKDLSIVESTDNGYTGRYLNLHNMMMGLDEVSNKDAKLLSNLIHKISNGKTKIRMQGTINAEREYEMSASLICLMTTNQSIINRLEILKANPDGEAARFIEMMVEEHPMLKSESGSELGTRIFNAFNFNYGHAGPMYVKELFRLGDDHVKEIINKWYKRFLRDFGGAASYRYHHNYVATIGAAGEIATNANIIKLDIERVYREVTKQLIMIKDNVIKINRTDYQSLIGDYYNRYINNFLVIKNGSVTMEPRGSIVGRVVSDDGTMQVSKSEFKKFLNERSISTREFEFEMRNAGVLVDDKKGRLTTGWKSAMQVDPAYLYWFKSEVPEELIDQSNAATGT